MMRNRKRTIPAFLISQYKEWLATQIAQKAAELAAPLAPWLVTELQVVEAVQRLQNAIREAIDIVESLDHWCNHHRCDCEYCTETKCARWDFDADDLRDALSVCTRILNLGLANRFEVDRIPEFDADWICDGKEVDVERVLSQLDDIGRDIMCQKWVVV